MRQGSVRRPPPSIRCCVGLPATVNGAITGDWRGSRPSERPVCTSLLISSSVIRLTLSLRGSSRCAWLVLVRRTLAVTGRRGQRELRCTAELATSLPSCRCSSDLPHCRRVFAMPGSEQHDDRGTGPNDEARKEVWGRASINLYVGHKPRQVELDVVDAVEAITVRIKDPSVCGMVEPRQCDGKRLRGAWIPSQNHVAHLLLERFDVNAPIELMRGHRRTP